MVLVYGFAFQNNAKTSWLKVQKTKNKQTADHLAETHSEAVHRRNGSLEKVTSSFEFATDLMLTLSFSKWVPEISHHCPRTPFLLVGTQVDLRDDSNTVEKLAKNKQRPISPESGEKLARDLRAVKYVECSALTQVKRAAAHTYDDITAFPHLSPM